MQFSRRGFRGQTAEEIALAISGPTPNLPLAGASNELSRVLCCAIASNAANRYHSVAAFCAELLAALREYAHTVSDGGGLEPPGSPRT